MIMNKVYILKEDQRAELLQPLRCKNEEEELQKLLQQNPDLLPSEQIDPGNPPQWLLIKREMPVPSPTTGSDVWSIDFLYVDHMAIPTLVECKRCDDLRSRREVTAQMLEYAANGHHYWSADDLHDHALKSAGGAEQLGDWISRNSTIAGSARDFFDVVTANLRESNMRLIFFLEESSNELRSLVDFLNRQLKTTEVLLVEARQYVSPMGRIVVPWLFGYTEPARVAKLESRMQGVRSRAATGEEAFLSAIDKGELSPDVKDAIQLLLKAWSTTHGDDPGWVYLVNAIFKIPKHVKTRGLFHLGRNGDIQIYFAYWHPENNPDIGPEQIQLRDHLSEEISKLFGITFNDKQLRGFPSIKATQWMHKLPEFIGLINRLL